MTNLLNYNKAIVIETGTARATSGKQPSLQVVSESKAASQNPSHFLSLLPVGTKSASHSDWKIILAPHHGSVPLGFQKWFAKLGSLARLKDGWDSYTAPAPTHEAIASANLYLSTLLSFVWEPTRVEASVMGGVGITHRAGTRKVYVEFYNNGTVHALFSDRSPRMETTPVGADVASYYRFIRKAREYLNG